MDIASIFRLNGIFKNNTKTSNKISIINSFIRNKIGVGVRFVFTIVIIYLIVTLFTIYNLLVGL